MLRQSLWIGAATVMWASATAGAVTIQMVTVGNPGNAGEPSGFGVPGGSFDPQRVCGAVDYVYKIGKFEVTSSEYAAFLNAVARTDTYGLYHTYMAYNPTRASECKILRSGWSGNYSYSVAAGYENRPVNFVSWGDAARFANWLTNGQPTGGQNLFTTEDGSYFLNGATSESALLAVTRKPNARYVIPSEDEWYKAAYHKNNGVTGDYWDYPTGSDTAPGNTLPDTGNNANYLLSGMAYPSNVGAYVNSPSPYGTFDQGGNMAEFNETPISVRRGARGAAFTSGENQLRAAWRFSITPIWESEGLGFRVAEVPEPASLWLLALAGAGWGCRRRWDRR